MNKKTFGETLFEDYLNAQNIAFEHEPQLPFTSRLIDYVVDHPIHGRIFLEVKDIEKPNLPRQLAAFDPYDPVRRKIEEAKKKFSDLPDALCALVLAARPGICDLQTPHVMLGAMYGDMGFTVPVSREVGGLDPSRIEPRFSFGRGEMKTVHGLRNTRIAAIISLHEFDTFPREANLYAERDDGRTKAERWSDVWGNRAGLRTEPTPCVTVWENGAAKRKLPRDIFRGEMDAWWTFENGSQQRSYIGQRRLALGIDSR
jgi:hypothetical protein